MMWQVWNKGGFLCCYFSLGHKLWDLVRPPHLSFRTLHKTIREAYVSNTKNNTSKFITTKHMFLVSYISVYQNNSKGFIHAGKINLRKATINQGIFLMIRAFRFEVAGKQSTCSLLSERSCIYFYLRDIDKENCMFHAVPCTLGLRSSLMRGGLVSWRILFY